MNLTYPQHAIETLRKNGFRITITREKVIQTLDQSNVPLSPYDVVDQIAKDAGKIDTVTVYRIFDCLEKTGLIHRILNSGKFIKCSIPHDADHSESDCCHHLAICDQCGATREIHCHVPIEVEDLPDMTIIGHRLEFIGRCRECLADLTYPIKSARKKIP